jgi:LPXTG cell wall anchor motif
MYPVPIGSLPITGANLLGFTLAGGALIIAGLIMLRLVFFLRKKRADGAAALPPGRQR